MIGFVVIVILYAVIGFLAATGTISISRKVFAPRAEQIFYAMFLILVAQFYLAFASYFHETTAWRLETFIVLGFVAISLLGTRFPLALVAGYSLHGVWDLLHELQAHGAYSAFHPGQLTAVPLAYGFFCAVFDFYVAAYFYTRRGEWTADRKSTL